MQLNVFSTDSQKNGFRLQYMEILNWGTFDGTIHTIRPLGETSLLTGANGSGKTTFVDALLTLIVPEKRYRFYNQSSGSEKKATVRKTATSSAVSAPSTTKPTVLPKPNTSGKTSHALIASSLSTSRMKRARRLHSSRCATS